MTIITGQIILYPILDHLFTDNYVYMHVSQMECVYISLLKTRPYPISQLMKV